MKDIDSITAHEQEAADYDQQVCAYNSYIHEALFGMSFELVNPGDCLLDIGIGTGLASQAFAKTGLEVHGCDASGQMLKVCAAKAFARELKICDLHKLPLPYAGRSFDHVVCCGVLHFFDDLMPILQEVSWVIKPSGMFAFTIAGPATNSALGADQDKQDIIETPTAWGVSIYKHSSGYIAKLLQANGFDTLKIQNLLVAEDPDDVNESMLFRVYIARQTQDANG